MPSLSAAEAQNPLLQSEDTRDILCTTGERSVHLSKLLVREEEMWLELKAKFDSVVDLHSQLLWIYKVLTLWWNFWNWSFIRLATFI
jgi:hypothetical protein